MSNTLLALSFDTADAAAIAGFWAEVLDRPVGDGATPGFAAVETVDAATTGLRLMFHRVPEGKSVKNRLHLDVVTDDLAAETTQLVAPGATVLSAAGPDGNGWSTMADPDGNEFDLIPG